MRLQKRLLQIALIRGGLVDDAAAVTVSHQNDAASAIRFNAKLNYAETDRDAPRCFTTRIKSRVQNASRNLFEKEIIRVEQIDGFYWKTNSFQNNLKCSKVRLEKNVI